jgi:glycosyltransferase involved in cell wall biosynthesis
VDYDDAVFHRYDQHPSRLVRAALGNSIDEVMRRSRLVIAGNDYLAERAKKAGARQIEILPSVVDGSRYHPAEVPPTGSFNLGWIGSPVTAPFLGLILPALQESHRQTGLRLTLVGGSISGLDATLLPWIEADEISDIQGFHAGIMPLPDAPFERGKCGYKLIQYMACGLPVIASPVGINTKIVRHGESGFLAESQQEWLEAILTLEKSPALRQRMGQAGRSRFEAEYSLQVTAPRLLALLRQAAS